MVNQNKKKPSGSAKQQSAYQIIGAKKFNIIQHLLKGFSLNRFEAEKLGDHCLHSTISSLSKDLEIEILREWEKVPNRFGGTTKVKRYWLSEADIIKVQSLI